MFAVCCMKLGKYGEAEKALEAEGTPVRTPPLESVPEDLPQKRLQMI